MMRQFRLVTAEESQNLGRGLIPYDEMRAAVIRTNPYHRAIHADLESKTVIVTCSKEPLSDPGRFTWEEITPEPEPSPRQLRIRRILQGFADMRVKQGRCHVHKRAQRVRRVKWVVEWEGKGAGEISSQHFKSAAGTAAEMTASGRENVIVRPVEVSSEW